MNDPPLDPEKKDITWRYRVGIERILERHPDVDLILFIEDDDWYSPSYIEVFYDAWNMANRPQIFGVGETYYYHVGMRRIYHEKHPNRASAFCTGISSKAIEHIKWPQDDYSSVDMNLWHQLGGNTFLVNPMIAVGMKGYNEGKFFGGKGHNEHWAGYDKHDPDLSWISSVINGKYSQDMISFYFGNIDHPMGVLDPLGPQKISFT